MSVYYLDESDLTPYAFRDLIRNALSVYDVRDKHFNLRVRKRISDYKWKGRSIVFRSEAKSKIILYGN